jgi:uncharacterized protein (TIGR03663 family)
MSKFKQGCIIALTLLFICMLFSRFYHLGARPFHHDESLFTYYAWTQFEKGTYTHDPLLHGPFQIQTIAGLFRITSKLGIIGNGDVVARSFAGLCACLLIFPLWGLRRWLGSAGITLLLGCVAVSPGLWFYGRFCRNESPFLLATALLILGVARAWRSKKPAPWIVLAFLSGATLVAMKENSLFLLFNGFWFAVLLLAAGWKKRAAQPFATQLRRSLWQHKYAWITGVASGWLLLEVVYTNFFQWDKSFLSFYMDIMRYWAGQHKEHRLYGEYHYYLPLLALYEPLSMLIVLGAAVRFLNPVKRFGTFILLLVSYVLGVAVGEWGDFPLRWLLHTDVAWGTLLKTLHMTQSWQLGMAFAVGWASLSGTWVAILRGKWFRAWLIWWCGMSLLQYSYAGEKVPWLALHIMLPLLLLAAEFTGAWWCRLGSRNLVADKQMYRMSRSYRALWMRSVASGILGLFLFVNLLQGARVCFENPTNPGDILIYNHTQMPVHKLGHDLRTEALAPQTPQMLLMQGNAMWPLLWYLHGAPCRWVNESEKPELEGVDKIVCDPEYLTAWSELTEQFEWENVPLRRAWVPETLHLFTFKASPENGEAFETGLMGWDAWRSLYENVVYRKMWGNATTTALPVEVKLGSKKQKH